MIVNNSLVLTAISRISYMLNILIKGIGTVYLRDMDSNATETTILSNYIAQKL